MPSDRRPLTERPPAAARSTVYRARGKQRETSLDDNTAAATLIVMFNRFLRRGVTAGGGLLAGSAAAYISAPVAAAPAAGPFDSVAADRTAKVENLVLGGRHKVILGWWPVLGARQQNDPRASSLRAIVAHGPLLARPRAHA